MLPTGNGFFDVLPEWVRHRLKSQLSLVELDLGVLRALIQGARDLYFPINCVIAVAAKPTGAEQTFLRFLGNQAALGLSSFLPTRDVHYESRVVGRGYVFTLPENTFFSLIGRPDLMSAIRCDVLSSVAEIAMINSSCAAIHSTSQRLARLLLEADDCFGFGAPITLTQLGFGKLLNVRRESAATLLNEWTSAGIVETGRGRLVVRERQRLTKLACGCYAAAKIVDSHTFDRWSQIPWDQRFRRPTDYAA